MRLLIHVVSYKNLKKSIRKIPLFNRVFFTFYEERSTRTSAELDGLKLNETGLIYEPLKNCISNFRM